jgi:tripartite-type tricarboxylate transporter receptor subunit TctC
MRNLMPTPTAQTFLRGNRRLALQTLGLAATAFSPWSALAQNGQLPIEQVKILCGFPAGGTADTTSRRVGDKFAGSAYTRNPAVVENKTGAGGRIAVEAVKNAAPDGSTLLLSAYSMLLIYPHIYRTLHPWRWLQCFHTDWLWAQWFQLPLKR